MAALRKLYPAALGLALILHGLAISVLPLRGADAAAPGVFLPSVTALYIVAIIGFLMSGLGVLGVRPLRPTIVVAALTGGIAALTAQFWHPDVDLWPGVVLSSSLPLLATLHAALRRRDAGPGHSRWR